MNGEATWFLHTHAWRQTRAAVLARDNYECQFIDEDGVKCGKRATVAGHIIPRVYGGSHEMENLRAECSFHSSSNSNPRSFDREAEKAGRRPSREW